MCKGPVAEESTVSITEGEKSECGYNMTSGKCAGDMGWTGCGGHAGVIEGV